MAASKPVRKARAALVALFVLLIGMGGLLAYGVQQDKAQWAPLLALDLEGGTQMVLSPQVDEGEEIDDDQLEQAVEIIRQRVDGTGVAEAEIAVQGAENVVVSLPGTPDEETRELIQASADMEFRPVLKSRYDTAFAEEVSLREAAEDGASEEELAELEEFLEQESQQQEDEETEGTAQPEDFPEPEGEPEEGNHSDPNWITPEIAAEFENYECTTELSMEERSAQDPDAPLVTCNPSTGEVLLLGPVDVDGEYINDASWGAESRPDGSTTGAYETVIHFDNAGTELFRETSQRLYSFPEGDDRNRFGIVLDGQVIVAPNMRAVITDGNASITGGYTDEEAQTLAEQLRYGSLPISFEIESEQQISATLGADQLRMGLLAGIIGLILTAGYAIYQYRALALAVTIPSLVVVALITWWALSLLGWSDGYRLSMAGIAGLILSIGLTADSFVVYFERVKDELREGRSLAGAVEAGWARARRTILASKAVNIIAAVVLYLVAVGNVRGFAFTLGLTALIDVILVFLFTHPLMQVLARRRFFASGKRFSGLSAKELGVDVLYKGAGRFARSNVVYSEQAAAAVGVGTDEETTAEDPTAEEEKKPSRKLPPSDPEAAAARREEVPDIPEEEWAKMTIAERRRARAKAQANQADAEQAEEAETKEADN
ncbi:protein translocase subunit SecD [Nesterenkonia sp. MY13]|uniref:Protein translocase subunit SecD n=1 Tax=Nesterenkonia sedimenti TaxID=1463632 RepID=A0A7X8THB5_9MICC|nr:protein translocase subunit SecD [Nesterenkonia sedimenti]NLS08733.1 protein translocase subunit SecD [Nesterenkonia sedimenti]